MESEDGAGYRDVMSLLGEYSLSLSYSRIRSEVQMDGEANRCMPCFAVKANSNEDEKSKLTRGEVIDQMGFVFR